MDLVLPTTEEESLEFKEWLAQSHGHGAEAFPSGAYGYGVKNGDGEIHLAVVVQTFHFPGNILVQYFSDDPNLFFQKDLIKRSFMVPFSPPLNARRITLVINEENERSIGVAKRMGFKEEGRMKFHFDNDTAVILGFIRPGMEV
jgi:hypothetical protein